MPMCEAMNEHFEARYGNDPYNGCLFAASHDEEYDSTAHMLGDDLLKRWQAWDKERGER